LIQSAIQEAWTMLRDLATCPAVTCPTTASVTAAADTMAVADIGFLVVVNSDEEPVGVLTDRDIVVRAVARGRYDATAVDVMTRHPASVSDQATAAQAVRLMADRQCRRLMLTDDAGKPIGVLSLDDLLRVAGDELGEIARAVRGTKHSHGALP
jgi:signal-transduction protein with cAMP-binding, CBS, and nucleotidyltransferase domain